MFNDDEPARLAPNIRKARRMSSGRQDFPCQVQNARLVIEDWGVRQIAARERQADSRLTRFSAAGTSCLPARRRDWKVCNCTISPPYVTHAFVVYPRFAGAQRSMSCKPWPRAHSITNALCALDHSPSARVITVPSAGRVRFRVIIEVQPRIDIYTNDLYYRSSGGGEHAGH
ncbi:hypothetical protein FKP32DRAFT_278930 [Trametes sanguinea]|nr:hypothetical protein FKP32DRAFT_278930 [Trametes sanguinea]